MQGSEKLVYDGLPDGRKGFKMGLTV